MDLISVIVPVYNVEKYLDRCIKSIINQTYSNLEIILVDDGSTDNSGRKCDEFALCDDRIKVIHKKNGGVSSARNAGLDIAIGDFIGFVDSDDFIELEMYETLIKNIKENNAEISCCQIQTSNINEEKSKFYTNNSKLFYRDEIVNNFFFNEFVRGFIVSPCNKIIAIKAIDNIRFRSYVLAEDFLFIFEVLMNCNRIHYDSKIGYHYCHRENSAMTSKFSEKRFDYIDAIIEIENICKEQYDENILILAHQWIFNNTLINYRAIIINSLKKTYPEKYKEYRKYLDSNKDMCFKNLNIKRKIDFVLSMYFPFIYKFIM